MKKLSRVQSLRRKLEGEEEELQRVIDYLQDQGVKLGEGLGGEAGLHPGGDAAK